MKNKWGLTALGVVLLAGGAEAAKCSGEDQSKASQVGQKIDLLERLLTDSEPLRRAQQSGDAKTMVAIVKAREALDAARQALKGGCVADASTLSSDGLKIATTAFRGTKKPDGRARDSFEAALQQASSFLLSLESQPDEVRSLSAEDMGGIERQIERAESLAADGNFAGALRLLAPVNDRLQRRLTAILDNKTIYYEKAFATPADEYEYLKQQYAGYLMLLQSGQKQASYSAKARVETQLNNAMMQFAVAEQKAGAGQWEDAISSMLEAVGACELAARATGYAY